MLAETELETVRSNLVFNCAMLTTRAIWQAYFCQCASEISPFALQQILGSEADLWVTAAQSELIV